VPVRPVVSCVAVLLCGLLLSAAGAPGQTDLDAFMQAVLERRDENWKKLQQYILEEREEVQLRGPGRIPVWGEKREYSWYMRDEFFVRSPTRVNGVDVPEADRVQYEAEYLERAKRRAEREREEAETETTDTESLLSDLRRPRFIDQAYFLKFKFEKGRYALVGRETFDGRDVLRIEYYPERLFDHEQNTEEDRRQRGERNRSEDQEAAFERMMNKVSLVTLWVEPASHQIVKYTFNNVNLDFLPAAWLVRLTDLQASMTMSQPFPDVWLPNAIEFYGGIMLALGPFDVRYEIEYFDYREATTSARIKRTRGLR